MVSYSHLTNDDSRRLSLASLTLSDIRDMKVVTISQRGSQFVSQAILPKSTNTSNRAKALTSTVSGDIDTLRNSDKIFDEDQNFISAHKSDLNASHIDQKIASTTTNVNKQSVGDDVEPLKRQKRSRDLEDSTEASAKHFDEAWTNTKRSKIDAPAQDSNLTANDHSTSASSSNLSLTASTSAPLPTYPPAALIALKSTRDPQIMATSDWISFLRGPTRQEIAERKRKLYESSAYFQPTPSSAPGHKRATLLNDDDEEEDRSQVTTIYSQPLVIEKDLIKGIKAESSMVDASMTPNHAASDKSAGSMESTQGRDFRRFRKNSIRVRNMVHSLKYSAMEKVLPKESERELEMRRELEAEENQERITEQLFSERYAHLSKEVSIFAYIVLIV
jgi:hypothetical protein